MQHSYSPGLCVAPLGRLIAASAYCLLLALLPGAVRAQAPVWQAATSGNNFQPTSGTSTTNATALDPTTGNVYVAGRFSGQVTFGNTRLVSVGGNDVYVAKWDVAAGAFTSAVSGGGTGADAAYGIAVSTTGGTTSVYVTGQFPSGTGATFAGTALAGAGSTDMFVARYTDTGTGLVSGGALSGGGTSFDGGFGVAVATAGGVSCVYVSGSFSSGTGATFAGTALPGAGGNDMFIARYTDTGTGLTNGGALSGGGTSDDSGWGLAALSTSGTVSVYVAADFLSGTSARFAGTTLPGAGSTDMAVARYTDAGSGLTNGGAVSGGGSGGETANGVAVTRVSGVNRVYVAGNFDSGTGASFAGTVLPGAGNVDVFLARYLDSGSGLANGGALSGGGSGLDLGADVAVSGSNVYVSASFASGTGASFAGTSLTGAGGRDLVVARYGDNGTALLNGSAVSGGGTGTDSGLGLAASATTVYAAGSIGTAVASFGSSIVRYAPPSSGVLQRLSGPTLFNAGVEGPLQGGLSAITGTATEPNTGNVYLTGYFSGSVAFGNTRLVSAGGDDMFVAKWDAAAGAFTNAVSGGGTAADQAKAVAVNTSGGTTFVYVTGYFNNGAASMAGSALSGPGNNDVFVARYTDTGTGLVNGGATSGGGPGFDAGYDIAVASAGGSTRVYVSGAFDTGGTVAGTALTAAGTYDLFVARYTDIGSTLAPGGAVSGGGTGLDYAFGVAATSTGGTATVYVTGSFGSGSGASIAGTALAGAGADDAFVAKYTDTGAGLTAAGALSGGGPGADTGNDLAVASTGSLTSVYVVGSTSGGAGNTIAGTVLPGAGGTDLFVARYTDAGPGLTGGGALSGGGTASDFGTDIAASSSGGTTTVYATGSFISGTGASVAGTALPGAGGTDLLVARYTDAGTGLVAGGALSGGGSGFDTSEAIAVHSGSVYVGGFVTPAASFGATTLANPAATSINVLARASFPALPVLTALAPANGAVGSTFDLTGTDLTGTTAITFTSSGGATTAVPAGYAVASSTSITGATVPAGLVPGAYTVTVTTPGGTSNGLAFTVNNPDLLVTSAQTIAPGTYRNITVAGPASGGAGVATLGGAVTVTGTATVQAGATLNTACQVLSGGPGSSFVLAAGGTLGICDANGIAATGNTGAIQTAARSFAPTATYVYNGTAPQATGTGLPPTAETVAIAATGPVTLTQPLALSRELRLTRGVFNLNGQGLTLLSDATATAQVNQDGSATTGTVTGGQATVQRYVPANGNAGLGYRHFASPVSGNSLADLAVPGGFQPVFNAAYNSSAASAQVTPFPNVFGFDAARVGTAPSSYTGFDQGWYSPATAGGPDAFIAGRGYTANLTAPQTVDFVGPLNQTAVAVALPRAAGTATPDDNKGWHLLGNPFASAFALAALDNTAGVDNAKYVFQSTGPYAGSYDTYLTGLTGQPLLAPGQGFFARVSTPGTAPTLAFALAGRRVDFTTSSTFHRNTTETRPLLELTLTNAAGTLRDRTTLYADAAATTGLDATHDAVKLTNTHGLNISQQAAGQLLVFNALPAFGAGTTVPLAVGVPAAGAYALQVSRLLNLPAGIIAVLVDTELNTRTDLAALPAAGYAFNVTSAQATALLTTRFYLNLAAGPLASGTGHRAPALALYPNPTTSRAATLTGATAGARVTVFDAVGRAVLTATAGATGTAQLVLPAAIAPGVYVVRTGTQAVRLAVE